MTNAGIQIFFKIDGPKWPIEQNIVCHFLKRLAQALNAVEIWVEYFTYTLTQTLVCIMYIDCVTM